MGFYSKHNAHKWLLVGVLIYTFVASTGSTTNSCPATPLNTRVVACTVPAGATTADTCADANAYCCYDDTATIPCRASDRYVCSLDGLRIGSGDTTITTVNGIRVDYQVPTEYAAVYPGEAVTFTCSGDKMFIGNGVVDSSTETVVQCVIDANGDMTNIVGLFTSIECQDTCKYVTFDATTQTLSVTVSETSPQRLDSTITMTCNAGYATDSGSTTENFLCTGRVDTSPSVAEQCYRCVVPAPANEHTTHDFTDSIPSNGILTLSCNDGYSFVPSSGDATVTCTSDKYLTGLELDMTAVAECQADCVLALSDDDLHGHILAGGESRTSLSVGSSVDMTCASGAALPVSQSGTVTCSASGDTITPELCQPLCELAYLKQPSLLTTSDGSSDGSDREIKIKTEISGTYNSPSGSTLSVAYGTMISMACKSSFSVQYSDVANMEFVAGIDTYPDAAVKTWVAPLCYKECTVYIGSSLEPNAAILSGGDTALTIIDNEKIAEGTVIRITCADATYSVKGTDLNYQDYTCTNGVAFTANKCSPPCQVSDLPATNDNTIKNPTVTVGQSQSITLSCAEYYRMGDTTGHYTTSVSSLCTYTDGNELTTMLETSQLVNGAVPATAQCYAYPRINYAIPFGDSMIKVGLLMPADRDTNIVISELKVTAAGSDASTVEECTVADTGTAADLECTITIPAGTALQQYAVTAALAYTDPALTLEAYGLDTTVAATLQSFAGPASLDLTGATTTATGVDVLTLVVPDAIVDAAIAISLYTVTYRLDVLDGAGSVVATKTINLASLKGDGEDFTDLGLSAITVYTMVVTSVLTTGSGGKSTVTFETGYQQPVVTSAVTHSTSNMFTITLGGGATYDGDLEVHINGVSYSITFAGGVGTQTLDGLTAMQEYTYAVIVKSANGVSSKTTTITFTQGPTEPVFGTPVATNNAVTVTWTYTADNLYYLNLYLRGADGTYSAGASQTHTTTADDGAMSSYMFSDLTAAATYKITAEAEMDVDGTVIKSALVMEEILIFSCSSSDKLTAYTLTYKTSGEAVPANTYLLTDANTLFNVACAPIDGNAYDFVTVGDVYDNVTACTGPNEWDSHSDCAEVTAEVSTGSSTGVVTGIVIAVILILVIIIVIIILIKRRKSNETNSKKYSPRDEEKNNEVDDGGEAWRNPYYQDNDNEKESPDIPDNKDVNGDNVSVEARVDFNDDEEDNPYNQPEGVVIPNNNAAEANENV